MTTQDYIQKTSLEFLKWVNYTEKKSLSAVKNSTYENPGDYNAGAGSNNYTVFAILYKEKTGINVQGQPWCDCFVDTVFIHLYGVDAAKRLLNGFSAYTPTSSNYFKKMNQWYTTPKVGDIIFFKNTERINHTGYVYKVDSTYVYTVEGNTSTTNNEVEANGGCVAKKYYKLTNERIAGYGRPNYALLSISKYTEGWMKAADNKRWWYQYADGSYAKNDGKNNGWHIFDNHYYLFDTDGYMLTGKQVVNGVPYFLWDEADSNEGKLMATYGNNYGGLTPWNIETHPMSSL